MARSRLGRGPISRSTRIIKRGYPRGAPHRPDSQPGHYELAGLLRGVAREMEALRPCEFLVYVQFDWGIAKPPAFTKNREGVGAQLNVVAGRRRTVRIDKGEMWRR